MISFAVMPTMNPELYGSLQWLLTWIAPITQTIGSLATIVGLLYALRAVPREWRSWKRRHAHERRAEAAAKVLTSTLLFIQALREASRGSHFIARERPTSESPAEAPLGDMLLVAARQIADDSGEWLLSDWAPVRGLQKDLLEAHAHAKVYLDREVDQLLERIWKTKAKIWTAQSMWIDAGRRGHHQDPRQFERGWQTDAILAELENEAGRTLRPLIELEVA